MPTGRCSAVVRPRRSAGGTPQPGGRPRRQLGRRRRPPQLREGRPLLDAVQAHQRRRDQEGQLRRPGARQGLVRPGAERRDVRVGHQANNYNGGAAGLGPRARLPARRSCCRGHPACIPRASPASPGRTCWPKGELSDKGFEDEQQFDNVYLLDAYVYGSFAVGDTDLQVRLGNQVVNWGESVFIQGVNQINPIDVPAARRAGAELKEILLPVWMAYANWGFDFGSVEAFYQLQWNNTSVDGCGTYWAQSHLSRSSRPARPAATSPCSGRACTASPCRAPSVLGPAVRVAGLVPQANGLYVPLRQRQGGLATAASSASRSASRSRRSIRKSACTR